MPVAQAEPLAGALAGMDAPAPPALGDLTAGVNPTGVLPFVVASSAGGRFGPDGRASGEAREGFWHGYSIVRVPAGGDPRGTIVEQRPVLDWITITAQEHTLRPGQRLTLRGSGREPIGTPTGADPGTIRFDRIDGPAITHRYDLLLADGENPSVPARDANGDYVPLPAAVATVDRQTGVVRARNTRGGRSYAVAVLSVGDKAATWPLVFEPRRSLVPQRARTLLPPLPRVARAPAAQQPLRVPASPPPPSSPPPATPASPLSSQTLAPPQPPSLPSLPALGSPAVPAPPALNAPPPPPAPPPAPTAPPQQQPLPLALNAKLQPVAIVPSVNPPAPPPVNPAPPAGGAARKEARQKQAAVAKSEEGAADQNAGVDTAESPNSAHGTEMAFRRHDRVKPSHSFTALHEGSSASAWSRTALYGGGLGLAALALSATWLAVRPRARRRPPEVPAPSWVGNRRG